MTRITTAVGARRDLDAQRSAIEDLLDQESEEVVVVLDDDGVVVSVTERGSALQRLFGVEVQDLVGRPILELVHPLDRAYAAERLASAQQGIHADPTEVRVGPAGGPYRHASATGRLQWDRNGRRRMVVLVRDIEMRTTMSRKLAHLAMHDRLTGLPNRDLFWDRLDQAMVRRQRQPAGVAVIVVNIDRFKYINEGLGSRAGDQVLRLVADRLRAASRRGDTLARLGGDEFGIICEGFVRDHDLVEYAERLRTAVRRHLVIVPAGADRAEVAVDLDCSIGIAFSPPDDLGTRTLLREADAAKNVVKANGRGGVELSTGGLSQLAREHLRLEQELRTALTTGALLVHYQPQVDRRTGRTIGVEALVRWNHPTDGLVPPGEFIPLAEESDLIVHIGRVVLRDACGQMARWHADGLDLELSVNLAARQLVTPGFLPDLQQILTETGLDPRSLTLEVTESTLFRDTSAVGATLAELRRLGVHLALDDFGTGYSSLLYLRRFHVEVIKIDLSFVRGIGRDPEDELIIRGIVNLAHSLAIDLVAEGVETDEEADWLVAAGCDVHQGYLYSRPQPPDALRTWLDERAADGPPPGTARDATDAVGVSGGTTGRR